MASGAPDPGKDRFARHHRLFDDGIARNDTARHRKRRLPHGNRRHVSARHLVHETVAVQIGVAPEPLGRLNPVMVVVGVVAELAKGDDVAGLMPGADDEGGRIERRRRHQAHARQAHDLARVPRRVETARERPEIHALRVELGRLAELEARANGLEIRRHLPGEHLEVSRAEHPCRCAQIGHRLERHRAAVFISRPASGHAILGIERREVEALAEHEDVGDEVSAPAGDAVRDVVAPGTGVGVRRGNTIEPARADERRRRIGDLFAGALAERPPAPFLFRPVRREQPLSLGKQFRQRNPEFLVVLEVTRNGNLASDPALQRCRSSYSPAPGPQPPAMRVRSSRLAPQ